MLIRIAAFRRCAWVQASPEGVVRTRWAGADVGASEGSESRTVLFERFWWMRRCMYGAPTGRRSGMAGATHLRFAFAGSTRHGAQPCSVKTDERGKRVDLKRSVVTSFHSLAKLCTHTCLSPPLNPPPGLHISLVEKPQDLPRVVLPPRLLVVHDARAGGEDDEAELTRRQQLHHPLLDVAEL